MVVIHKPTTLSYPTAVLQLIGAVDFFSSRLAVHQKHWEDKGSHAYGDDKLLSWYVIHGLLVIGQVVWGLPLARAAKRFGRRSLASFLFVASMVASGVVTALPILPHTNLRENFGFAIYVGSFIHNACFGIYLADIIKSLLLGGSGPTEYFQRQEDHHFAGRLEALFWFSNYQLTVYVFRYRLLIYPVLNTILHWIILLWHFYLLFYFGSHKPRYESAVGLADDGKKKKTQ